MEIRKIKQVITQNIKQLVYVFVAFFVMVSASYLSIGAVVRRDLFESAQENLEAVEINIRYKMREPEIALFNASFAIKNLVENGASQERINEYLAGLSDSFFSEGGRISGFNGTYGYIRGEYLDGLYWQPPDDYIPTERPWYIKAMEGHGKTAVTDPYIDAQTGSYVVSYSQELIDSNGVSYGVIALDISINEVAAYVESIQLAEGGYGLLVCEHFDILAHPNPEMIGHNLTVLSDSYSGIIKELEETDSIFGKRIINAQGIHSIIFMNRIFNGWYLATITPVSSYYSDIYLTAIILAILGLVLMMFLSGVLLKLSAAQMRSDEKNKLKTRFLARMSHEIRTPMNAIIGMSELALRSNDIELTNKYVADIRQSGHNLLSIINDILDISKIESGMLRLSNGKYLIASVINDAINIIRIRLNDKPILFSVNIDANIPNTLIGDETYVRQILLNILSNAVKYTNEGFVSLNVTGECENNEITLTFEVTDSGVGIREEDLDKLFGNFVRVGVEDNKGVEGTGLGLAISQSLCKAMKGQITVTSVYGEGSVFTAVIKQEIADYEEIAKVIDAENIRLLLYEERSFFRTSIMKTLQNLKVSAKEATCAKDFFDEFVEGNYTFAFIPPSAVEMAEVAVQKYKLNTELVLLTDIKDDSNFLELVHLSLPAYAVPVANVLNGTVVRDDEVKGDISFTTQNSTVLIVDDFAANLQVAEGLLSPYKVKIHKSLNAHKALKLIRENEYDIVFMDHMMPGMDGIQALEAIRARMEEHNKRLTVVALTANAISGMKEMFLNKGFDDYLAKPIEISKLNEVMERWIPDEKKVAIEKHTEYVPRQKATFAVKGLNIEKGITLSGGTEEKYLKVLNYFFLDSGERIQALKEMDIKEDIVLYTTYVHAFKSGLAVIGADNLSKMAEKLEVNGRSGNVDFLTEHTPKFVSRLEELIKNIEDYIKPKPVDNEDKDLNQSDDLTEKLMTLRTALENDDIIEIDKLIDELSGKELENEEKEMFASISEAVLISEFSKAIETIDNYTAKR